MNSSGVPCYPVAHGSELTCVVVLGLSDGAATAMGTDGFRRFLEGL